MDPVRASAREIARAVNAREVSAVEIAETMNHCKPRTEMIRILRDYTPNANDLFVGEDIVPSAWRHAGVMKVLITHAVTQCCSARVERNSLSGK